MPINRTKTESFRNLELLAKKVVEGFITGLHKSPFHGFSVEFAEHRLYNTGESTRHIDWKLFARTEKLFMKRYEEETNLRCQIVLDLSSSMQFPQNSDNNKLTFSVHAAAALTELFKQQRDAVGLSCFTSEITQHLPAKGSPLHFKQVMNALEEILENKSSLQSTSTAEALDQIAEIIHQRSLVIIFSDLFEDEEKQEKLFAALQHLKYKKHEVVVFHVVDKKQELDFSFDNKPHRFIDLETGAEIKLNPAQIRDQYTKRMAQLQENIVLKCGAYKIDFVAADINEGFDTVLYTYLVKRKMML